MMRTRHELAPAVTIQEAIDAADMHRMLDLRFKNLLNFFGRGNFPLGGSGEKGLEKAAFLLQAHVFMTASAFAWGFNRSKSQAVVGANDAAHRRDRHARISGNLLGFSRAHQGQVNNPPAFSNPIAWVHFHALFDFFQWNMSSGSCDSRSHSRSSSLPTLFPLLYHLERELVSGILLYEICDLLSRQYAETGQRRTTRNTFLLTVLSPLLVVVCKILHRRLFRSKKKR